MSNIYTKVSEQGNIIEITTYSSHNNTNHITKISKDEYIVNSEGTGEIHQFKHGETRADAKQTLHRTFRAIRALVNTNCSDIEKVRWITLTYAENMQNRERLYNDFKAFWKRFKRRWGHAEYIVVAEPQERGAWHMHLLAIFPEKAPFISNDELRDCWRNGFVNVRAIKDVDNVGAYLSAYLGDVEVDLDSPVGEIKELKDGTKKKFVKGARLKLYPPGMNIYRCSRGVKRPNEFQSTEDEVKALTHNLEPTYANSLEFENEQGFRIEITKTYYNRLRPKHETPTELANNTVIDNSVVTSP